jgi:transcription-repair coupling factor (superfamily II helicase)
MKALFQPLQDVAGYEDLLRQLKDNRGMIEISGCLESQKAHIAAGLAEDCPAVLLIAENELKAKELYEDYRLYDRDVLLFPARDLIFYQADLSGNLLTRQRMQVIQAILERKHVTVITSAGGCMDRLLPLRVLKRHMVTLKNDSPLDLEKFSRKLTEMGYERCAQVELPGQYSVRGGILDIYSLTEENPWRVELWGDEIDSIRSFDAESQRSVENLSEITIYPASEEIGREEKGFFRTLTDTFPDYFPDTVRIFLDEPGRILESARAVFEEYRECMVHRMEKGQAAPEEGDRLLSPEELAYGLNRRNCVGLCLMEQRKSSWDIRGQYGVTVKSVSPYNNQFPMLVKDLKQWKKAGYRVILLCPSRTRGGRLARDLQEDGLNAFCSEEEERLLSPGEILVLHGNARRGFEYPMQKFVLITETDIFGREQKKKKKKSRYSGEKIQSFAELSPGDFVVHENHGLGIYRGIEKVEVDHVVKDYIKIEYSGGSSLYIQATQLDALQKYAGSDAKKPKLNKLGGQEWNRTKSRVRGAVADIAKDLVALYAARQQDNGYCYGPDTVWQREFEELFPFEETEDQLAAIEATKRDMESTKIMDRLICGDVGYGKTEIAIRAAFKAVQENKQVVLLVPTTILAQQHYNTFVQRMKDFPVRVDLLCRFRTPAQQKKTLEDLKKGMVDILIGTHRVLSKDVRFKDLGLLVIDEEQRFGVAHKEKIKQMKERVDVLTLTATPIPRTLHMSLIGIRDMSVLEEAPLDRVPVQTYVMEYDEEMVREAVSREMARGGQVYYVYNRVNTIAEVASRLARLVPEAEVAFAHGQMKERELEQIMYRFVNGEIDVLVSTTIIETGLDISNVNTIIIHDADRMGLSQLYQLRGRVGRTNRTAYAFLLYRRDKMLKEVAEKRLHAIREFTELGSGVKIAMRDLEIRGAGNLLGAEQHGHMEAVGYDLYCKMLSEAVKEARGEKRPEDFETSVDLETDAYIPPSYIPNEGQKLDIYKRIAGVENGEEAADMLEELIDRFGEPPRSVQNLLAVAELKALAHRAYVTEIKQTGQEIRITLYEKAKLNAAGIPELLEQYGRRLKFKLETSPYFLFYPGPPRKKRETVLDQVREFAGALGRYAEE